MRMTAHSNRAMRRFVLAALLGTAVLAALPVAARKPAAQPVTEKIEIAAKPIPAFEARDPQRRQFGKLLYRGGIALSSTYKNFGGVSAIRVGTDGERFLALTDRGYWLRGRIQYQGQAPVGVADAEMSPILGPDGRPLTTRGWHDTESLTEDSGVAYVGIERVHQILRFELGKQGLVAPGRPIPVPVEAKSLPPNKGLEALALVPKGLPLAGTLIAFSESAADEAGNARGFLIGGPSPGLFGVKRSDDFDLTDAAVTPAGDLLLLERRFTMLRGPGMRIRRIPLADIKPGALVDGPALVEADAGYQIDNMEGLSLHRADSGELVLTLVSDDNFSSLQRTILLQFTLPEP
jgi:hypothetical protein